jgi:hypothetical protein
LLCLCTNSGSPSSFEGNKCCWHDWLGIVHNLVSLQGDLAIVNFKRKYG